MKVSVTFFSLFLCISFTKAQTDFYPMDPMPGGGPVYSLAVNSQNHFFAVTALDVFRSTDLGKSWQSVNLDFSTNPFNPLAAFLPQQIAINSNDEIYLATNIGIYKSTDNGDSFDYWNEGIGDGMSVGAIYAASDNDLFATNGNGLYRRTDADTAWILMSSQLNFASSFTSSDDTTIYASQTFAGVFKSTDNGATWMPANGTGLTSTFVKALEYNPNSNIVYAGTGDAGLFQSTDGGKNWSNVSLQPDTGSSITLSKLQSDLFEKIEAMGFFGQVLWISTGLQIYGVDPITAEFIAFDVASFIAEMEAFEPSPLKLNADNNTSAIEGLLLGSLSEGILNYSETEGVTNISNGLTGYIPTRMVQTGNLQVIGTAFAGLIILDNSGIRHVLLDEASPEGQSSILGLLTLTATTGNKVLKANESGTVLFALYYRGVFSGIYRSPDLGVTWEELNLSFDVSSFVKDDALNLYATSSQGIHFSQDMGETWELRNNGLPGANVVFLVFNESTNTLFCIFEDGSLYKSSDKGINWTQAGNTTLGAIGDLKVSSTGEMYASSAVNGIAHSTDNGETWEKINSGLPTAPYPALLEVNSAGNLFAAGFGVGVYKSNDNGESWHEMSGLPSTSVTTLYMNENDILFAGTYYDGIYSTQQPTSVEQQTSEIPERFSLSQNYPNPFNPSTTIQFALPKESFVKLEIFNLLGEKVSTLVSERLRTGKYNYEWNAKGLSSGVYLYRLSASNGSENYVKTKKLLLMK